MYDCQQLQLMYQIHQVKNDNDYTLIKSRIKEEKKWWYGTGVNMSKKLQNNRPVGCRPNMAAGGGMVYWTLNQALRRKKPLYHQGIFGDSKVI